MKISVFGMAWYRRETFGRLRKMFKDGHKLHRTYDEWLAAAEEGCKRLEAQGARVIRADIDPDQFPKWCRSKGLKLDAAARTEYANTVAHDAMLAECEGKVH
jgi:hypothetical protein